MARKIRMTHGDIEIDLTAMIDVIFLLIVFFILAGRITSEMRSNKITVPPARTAEEMQRPPNWRHAVVEVFGSTTRVGGGGTAPNTIKIGWTGETRTVSELDDYSSYVWLRQELDALYMAANRYDDPLGTGIQLPEVELEIRADGDAEYRLVQEILQVASDSVDPANGMKPKNLGNPPNFALAKPFVNILFTSFRPGDRETP